MSPTSLRYRRAILKMALTLGAAMTSSLAQAQVYPPGSFAIDGVPVSCGGYPTVVTSQIGDAGIFDGRAIYLNPASLGRMPTVLKLFVYAHECGHAVVGANEPAADCWAIRLGRDQGWFPPEAFGLLMRMFQGNPGSMHHPPGAQRVQNMLACYQS